jgi:WD40 repeat protein
LVLPLALLNGSRPGDTIWHTVTTQPRTEPFRQLGEAVNEAAKGLGLPLAERCELRKLVASRDPENVRVALRCDLLPAEQVRVLLVVDQFEELLTITPDKLREPFIDLLLDLADPADDCFRVVLTMRHDYVNLCSAFGPLKDRLDADQRRARFALGRVSDKGLRWIVTEPLCLAGVDPADREALAVQVLRDVGERPGDLALVQMALTETWHARHRHGGDLLRAYVEVGGVEGALAQAAERVRTQVLVEHQQILLASILLRLVRLGDTGGATRRVAARREFDEDRWRLVQKLASEDGKRLVLLGGSAEQPTVEIAHEALVTAWPYFQNLLQATADDKRILDALIPPAQSWSDAKDQKEREKRLATGADLELFGGLLERRAEWLSDEERQFIKASEAMERRRHRRDRMFTRALGVLAATLLIALAVAGWMSWSAIDAGRAARANESRALAALSEIALSQHRPLDAIKLAVAAWPRRGEEDRPKLRSTVEALRKASCAQRQLIPPLRHDEAVSGAVFSRDGSRILSWSNDNTARMWDAASGQPLLTFRHEDIVYGAVFSRDEGRILSWSEDHTARVWDAATGQALLTLRHEEDVYGAVFSGNEGRILSWSRDGTARVWDAATGGELLTLRHEKYVYGALFSGDERRILSWSGNAARVWDAATGRPLLTLRHDDVVSGAAFSGDGHRILSWSSYDRTARVWDAATGQALLTLRHHGPVWGARFSAHEPYILSWAGNAARVWDAATGQALLILRHEGVVNGAVFSGDGRYILSWAEDDITRLWDAATAQELLTLRHHGPVWGARFSAHEPYILSWSADRTARLWDMSRLSESYLIAMACKSLRGEHDTSVLKERYNVAITTSICMPDTPQPEAAELKD